MKVTGPKLYKDLKTSGEISPLDFKYMKENPDGDIGFSVEHNRKVIEDSIKATDAMVARKQKDYDDQLAYRTEASAHFLKALMRGKYNSSDPHTAAQKYFGKELAVLRGEEIKQEMIEKMKKTAKDIGLN